MAFFWILGSYDSNFIIGIIFLRGVLPKDLTTHFQNLYMWYFFRILYRLQQLHQSRVGIRNSMGELHGVIFLSEIIAKGQGAVKLFGSFFPQYAIFLIKNVLPLSFPTFTTGTRQHHWLHALVIKRGCLILSSDKIKTVPC